MRLLHAVVLLSACNFSLSSVGFDIPYSIPEQSIPGDATAHAAGIVIDMPPTTFPINVDIAAQAKANNVSGVISTVTLTSLSFNITKSSGCFDFVNSVSLALSSTKTGTTLQPTVIAAGGNPGCVQTYPLTPTPGANLKPYIDEGASVTMTGQAIPPAADVTFDGAIVLHASL